MRLLHRSSMFGGGTAPRRGVSSPRAPPPRQQHKLFSRSDSIKKRSATAKAAKGSKRARLRAGLAAALQELKLAGRHRRGSPVSAGATRTQLGSRAQHVAACPAADADAGPPRATAAFGTHGSAASGGAALLLLLALLALVCVVALGRAPAVCCCTCAAWWCRSSSAAARHRQTPPPHGRNGALPLR